MATAFISNSNLKGLFPSALSTNASKFTSEKNITGIIRAVVDNNSYIISGPNGANNEYEFVLNGYYFKIIYSNVGQNLWVGIYTDDHDRLIGFTGTGDVTTEMSDGTNFRGLLLGTTVTDVTKTVGGGYNSYRLQIVKDGQLNKEAMYKFTQGSIKGVSTYDPESDDPVSSKAIKAAIETLDVAKVGQTGYFISEISETDGKISATASQFSVSNTLTDGTSSAGPKISTSVNSITGSAVELNKATTSVYGVTKLSSTKTSSATDVAATPKMVSDIKNDLSTDISQISSTVSGLSSTVENISSSISGMSSFNPGGTPAAGKVIKKYSEATNYGWETLGSLVVTNSASGITNVNNITNGNVRINLQDGHTALSSTKIKGTGIVTVTATSGEITINATSPTIPTVNNATLTIQKNGADLGSFTANSSTNTTINISGIPTVTSGTSLPPSGSEGDIFILY